MGSGVVARFGSAADGDLHIDADPAGLALRRAAICRYPWTWLRQVHGPTVVVVDRPGDHAGDEADAAVTQAPGAALAIHSADCAPVLFEGIGAADAPVIGAAHAGWRGLEAGVLEATVAQMRALGADDISARLGPCISPAAYPFGTADLTRLAFRFGPDVVGATALGEPAFDLRAAVRQVLADLGVPLDVAAVRCTALDPGWFSWRARAEAGRQASLMWIEP
jgi:YfiH family protein